MRVCSWEFQWPLICSCKSSINHCSPQGMRLDVAQSVGVVVEEKGSSGEKIEVEKSGLESLDGGKVEVVLKSSLKKPLEGSNPKGAGEVRVKWMDFVGKDLVQIKEFETNESWESDDNTDANPACMCVIQ
ncbi:hypothetical protein J5N97_010803 [Dioscorea zingiberensis]|uniref:Uncharacterized protein n=1 Tax=Dioscorea zingiberensis TaxID=325984 RepID=A0A9D5HN03_9LILI|nr:hypothetical protein J5N97_010803 [Dioscorea zingiberensis]